jgi:hypothetical protein
MTNASNAVIGFPRWTGVSTFAADGGTAAALYPVTNLGSLPVSRVWRSADATTANTKFAVTLDKARPVRLLGLVGHNLSLDATMRVRLYSDFGLTTTVYDSGWVEVWPEVFTFGSLEWEDDRWWTLKYSPEELTGYRWTRPIWLDGLYVARGIRVEFQDTTNADGYVECGLFEVAQGWQVSLNPDYGAEYGFQFRTQSTEALGGSEYFDRRAKGRVFKGQIGYLPNDEAMSRAFEAQRQLDLDTPFLWVLNPQSTTHLIREAFLARNVDPGLMSYAAFGVSRVPISVREVL